jgi:hypothetical protein
LGRLYCMKLLLLTCFGAALAAYAGNRALYRRLGPRAAISVVPWWEEGVKLIAAALTPGVPMLFVHMGFGALELAYDLRKGENDALFLGVLTFAGHGLFGGVAMLAADSLGGLWWAYLAAGLTHMVYMAGVVHYVLPTLGAGIHARR